MARPWGDASKRNALINKWNTDIGIRLFSFYNNYIYGDIYGLRRQVICISNLLSNRETDEGWSFEEPVLEGHDEESLAS